MIRLVLTYIKDKGSWFMIGQINPLPRPFFLMSSSIFYHLTDEIHKWLEDNNMIYNLQCDEDDNGLKISIYLKNIEHVILFKLTWF
jgi:hypothetical protein